MDGLPINYNFTYYVKANKSPLLGNRYFVYCHYPHTPPDTIVKVFTFEENAEMFCKVLNAESQGVRWTEYKEVK